MDSSGVLIEEQKLMTEPKYRVYMSNIDKALKNFEYSSEWADLISALGKLNKAISSNTQYQVIPRRIKISKRLAQCMHPALPSGVHLKALETYDVIFSKTGAERLATELFIYSAGLFPLLGYAAMNVRPTLLGIYETYFVPLGDRLRPALSGFLCGVITGYESGLDHFDRTSSLLNQVCNAVNPTYFYTCLWECVATNASIRLPAVSYLLDHFNKRLSMQEQSSIMGKSHDVLMSGLVSCLNDPVILVQRNTLEFLLLGFPMHTNLLTKNDFIKLVTNGLNTILRRDMSLNRRLYSWLLGTEVLANRSNQSGDESGATTATTTTTTTKTTITVQSYFDHYSKDVLIQALKCTLKISLLHTPVDLKPYRILVSLLDKVEIGPAVLDHVLCDVIRTMALSNGNVEVNKSANLLFATFDPSYIWNFMTLMYEKSCKAASEPTSKLARSLKATSQAKTIIPEVDSGEPSLCEVCFLTEFLLETITLEMYNETTRVYLPRVFLSIIQLLTVYSESLIYDEVSSSLKLCMKIVSRVQPMITSPVKTPNVFVRPSSEGPIKAASSEGNSSLEKSKSDSKINQSAHDDEPIRRSNSNHNIIKRSPKKTKKSKSYSKLLELDKDISSSSDQLSVISANEIESKKNKSKKFSPSMKMRNLKGKSAQDLKIDDIRTDSLKPPTDEHIQDASVKSENSRPDLTETTTQEYSILEMCIKQYEIFFQVYIASQVLDIKSGKRSSFSVLANFINDQSSAHSMKIVDDEYQQRVPDINAIFETLKLNDICKTTELQNLLNKTIKQNSSNGETSDCDYKDCFSSSEKLDGGSDNYDENAEKAVNRLINLKLTESLRTSVKLASNLLIEMSTFPNNKQNLANVSVADIPPWLKVLVLLASYSKADKELQIASIQTLFDLISLLQTQTEHSSNPGVTYVVMLPLLKFGHVNYLETKTRVIQVITSTLWNFINDRSVDSNQICSLLYQLHNCLSSGIVQTVIGHRMANTHLEWSESFDEEANSNSRTSLYKRNRLADLKILCTPPPSLDVDCSKILTESEAVIFKKFEILWEYGRDNQSPKGFEKTLLKVYDYLSLPYHVSIRTFVTKWLQESLLRSDLNRLLRPLLRILLASNTKRISVLHAHLLKKYTEDSYSDTQQERGVDDLDNDIVIDKDVYAISSEDGQIKYHMEMARNKKRSPIRSLQKKLFGVTIGNKNKTSNYISDKSLSPSEITNISLIVNPMDNSAELEIVESSETVDISPDSKIEIAEPNSVTKHSPPKDDYYSSCEEETDETFSDTESERHDESLDHDISLPGNDIKRYAGDCDRVSDILTEHDRTKNRKTYYVTKDGSKVIEKMPMAPKVSDGICIQTEESTPAEDYFSNSASIGGSIVDAGDFLEHISESIDDNTSSSKSGGSSKQLVQRYASKHPEEDGAQKRLSTTSKVSSDSNNSSNFGRDRQNRIASNSNNGYESDPSESKLLVGSVERQSIRSQNSQPIGENCNKNGPTATELISVQSSWEKTQESLEISKKNVEVLRQNALQENPQFFERKLSQSRHRRHYDRLHPLHTHMLLYLGVYDTKQVLYAFQTMRNIIACDCRTFLCLSITTSLTNNTLKQLLIRHRKSIFGKGFSGSIHNTEFSHTYRGCMYLEALVTICLYYARSYFQRESVEANKLPTGNDIKSNCKIQLASIELLTTMCNELILIVKDMGKGLACYIADLMAKCKLQKIVLNCIISCVHLYQSKIDLTLTETIIEFNTLDDDKLHSESLQVQLLRLLMSIIKLEFEVHNLKGDETNKSTSTSDPSSSSPTRLGPHTPTNTKYLPNCLISQQPMFLYAVLKALQAEHLRHLHRNWTDLVTSSLNCFTSGSLTNIVISVIHQLCGNVDEISKGIKIGQVPLDYAVSQLEALTILCHYCLLENSQQTSLSHLFTQSYPQINSTNHSSNTGGQLLNNIVHAILSTPQSAESLTRSAHILAARNAVLSHLPVIIASVARLWDTKIGQSRQVKQQLLEFLSPISLHHGTNFLAAMSVTWQERGDVLRQKVETDSSSSRKSSFGDVSASFLPYACQEQLSLVKLVSNIRVMPMDSFVQTLHLVVKSPPNIHHPPPGLCIEVSALELFYFYMKAAAAPQLGDCWSSLLALLRDGLNLVPPAQFVILAILNEFVQRCPQMPFQDRKDVRDLHDVTARLVEALSAVAGARLEQTTWLRRNLAVKEDLPESYIDGSFKEITSSTGNQQYSVQAQSVMAAVLANLLDVTYGSQEKDKVVAIITTLMYNITPYLKNHTVRNIPSFYACSQLLATLSGYQYTRKAWRKDMLDLVLDPCFFQMDMTCLPFWKQILDSLMTYDNTTFRELMSRVSLTQAGGLNLFTSREQEYEQRALLLKRLAFVIFCSELDQYHKYMPEIQEQLANSLRLPSVVPAVQSAVFLCFRVLLLRMTPDHVTSLWPTIIAEMVQVFLAIEQELKADNEEFSQQLRLLSGMDAPWATNPNNGVLNQHHLAHWRTVQLETAKLLELSCVLPATNLPYFQMYRWAFVGSQYEIGTLVNGNTDDVQLSSSLFIPHVRRIARLMDLRFNSHSPKPQMKKGQYLTLTCQTIANLQDLYGFFSTLGAIWRPNNFEAADNHVIECLAEIEDLLAADFLEKMPSNVSAR